MKLHTMIIVLMWISSLPCHGMHVSEEEIFEVVPVIASIPQFEMNPLAKTPRNAQEMAVYFEVKKISAPNLDFSTAIKICPPSEWTTNYIPEWQKIIDQRRQSIVPQYYMEYKEDIEAQHLHIKELGSKIQQSNESDLPKRLNLLNQQNRENEENTLLLRSSRQNIVQQIEKENKLKKLRLLSQSDVLELLYKQQNVTNDLALSKKLTSLAYSCQDQTLNNRNLNYHWKKENHLLISKITEMHTVAFCPCTGGIMISNEMYTYPFIVNLSLLPKAFLCKRPCKNIKINDNLVLVHQELKKQFSVKNDNLLIDRLTQLAKTLSKKKNQSSKTASFNPKYHFLTGKINKEWIYVFCPCNQRLGFTNEKYPCSFETLKKTNVLPKKFLCQDNCPKYIPKKYSTQLDFSSGSDCESDSEKLISKSDIEKDINL